MNRKRVTKYTKICCIIVILLLVMIPQIATQKGGSELNQRSLTEGQEILDTAVIAANVPN